MALTKKQLNQAETIMKSAVAVKLLIHELATACSQLAEKANDEDLPAVHAVIASAIREAGLSTAKDGLDAAAKGCLATMLEAGVATTTSPTIMTDSFLIPAYNFKKVTKTSAQLLDKDASSFLRVLEVIVKHSKPDAIEKRLSAKGFTPNMLEECEGLVGLTDKEDWSITKAKG